MTQKPVNPPKQTTPPNQSNKNNIGNFGGSSSTSISIDQSSSGDGSLLKQLLNQLAKLKKNQESNVPISVEISPADTASIPSGSFLSIEGPIIAGSVNFQLPSNFTYTLSPESSGKYGSVITSDTGQQSVTVNVTLEPLNGIIDYEVRLIKND